MALESGIPSLGDRRGEEPGPRSLGLLVRLERPHLPEEPLGRGHDRLTQPPAPGATRLQRATGPFQLLQPSQQIITHGISNQAFGRGESDRASSSAAPAAEKTE